MVGHRMMGHALLLTGEIAAGQAHYSQGLALYDPVEHRPFATRFGQDISVANMGFRSLALWLLGYPEKALADANRALKDAQEIGQAATLMFALNYTAKTQIHCGHFAVANSLLEQVIALADQKGAPYWKGFGMTEQACVLLATGDTSAAVNQLKLGMTTLCSTGATLFVPWLLSNLARAYGDLGELDDARRCIDEATTTMETSNQRWCEAETNRIAGEIGLLSPKRDAARAEAYFERALDSRPPTTSQILGTPRRHEPRTPLARPGQGERSARTARSGLRLVHRGLRHARSEGSEGAAGGVGLGQGHSHPLLIVGSFKTGRTSHAKVSVAFQVQRRG